MEPNGFRGRTESGDESPHSKREDQPMNVRKSVIGLTLLLLACCLSGLGQEYGPPDRGQPGDEMIQAYLADEADRIHAGFLSEVKSLEDWQARRPRYKEEYFHMLGLCPMPEKTPLEATITGTLEGDGYRVDMIHFQSRPRLYVTGNLYRPAKIDEDERLPAVLYVCGHCYQGRSGNKTAYQSHGIWFARHGYLCLTIDSLQLGEIGALHHGTYRENRWWWHSRGYTPAGVECLNGMRAIDYLTSRPDVDPERIAVTGISGGGAASFWIAAADERVKVTVPVSGMADLPSYVNNRVINGHCDCMFLYNTFQWPWTRIAALVAPRALLLTNSDQDRIFPMDANDRIINRLERVYSLYGRTDFVDAVVSIGGHAYRQDIRQAAFRFINMQLKNDPRVVEDSEVDLVTGPRSEREYPIPIDKLRVFPEDGDIPGDELNTTIDEHFVPVAKVEPPKEGGFDGWKANLLAGLERVTFGYFPERIPPAKLAEQVNGASRSRT
jgi:dienelactone hydrolase